MRCSRQARLTQQHIAGRLQAARAEPNQQSSSYSTTKHPTILTTVAVLVWECWLGQTAACQGSTAAPPACMLVWRRGGPCRAPAPTGTPAEWEEGGKCFRASACEKGWARHQHAGFTAEGVDLPCQQGGGGGRAEWAEETGTTAQTMGPHGRSVPPHDPSRSRVRLPARAAVVPRSEHQHNSPQALLATARVCFELRPLSSQFTLCRASRSSRWLTLPLQQLFPPQQSSPASPRLLQRPSSRPLLLLRRPSQRPQQQLRCPLQRVRPAPLPLPPPATRPQMQRPQQVKRRRQQRLRRQRLQRSRGCQCVPTWSRPVSLRA